MVNAKPWPLYPRDIPGNHFIGGLVGSRAGLDGCGKSRTPPTGIRSADRPARSQSLYRLSYPGPVSFSKEQNQLLQWVDRFCSLWWTLRTGGPKDGHLYTRHKRFVGRNILMKIHNRMFLWPGGHCCCSLHSYVRSETIMRRADDIHIYLAYLRTKISTSVCECTCVCFEINIWNGYLHQLDSTSARSVTAFGRPSLLSRSSR